MRLDQRSLHINLTGKEMDNYSQSHFSSKASLEQYKDDLMATSVRKTFMYYNRVIRTLENNHIYTLGDLSMYSIADILTMKGVGGKTLSEIQEVLKANGLNYLVKSQY